MMGEGFPSDTISSDVHALCIDGPAYDQVTTMSNGVRGEVVEATRRIFARGAVVGGEWWLSA
jgi:hypothetical protein